MLPLDKRALINTVNEVATASVECERLYRTPVPLLYTGHTLKFFTFWVTTLPFALNCRHGVCIFWHRGDCRIFRRTIQYSPAWRAY
eukprot:1108163-Ditylum_brightwellii.AAC.1